MSFLVAQNKGNTLTTSAVTGCPRKILHYESCLSFRGYLPANEIRKFITLFNVMKVLNETFVVIPIHYNGNHLKRLRKTRLRLPVSFARFEPGISLHVTDSHHGTLVLSSQRLAIFLSGYFY